jgi:hypothetical protein
MVPGGSRESLPKRKVRFADNTEVGRSEAGYFRIADNPPGTQKKHPMSGFNEC